MTDKERIKSEIERRINDLYLLLPDGDNVLGDLFTKEEAIIMGRFNELESLRIYIENMEDKNNV